MYHIFSELSPYYGGERNERAAAAAHAKGQNGREKRGAQASPRSRGRQLARLQMDTLGVEPR